MNEQSTTHNTKDELIQIGNLVFDQARFLDLPDNYPLQKATCSIRCICCNKLNSRNVTLRKKAHLAGLTIDDVFSQELNERGWEGKVGDYMMCPKCQLDQDQ